MNRDYENKLLTAGTWQEGIGKDWAKLRVQLEKGAYGQDAECKGVKNTPLLRT